MTMRRRLLPATLLLLCAGIARGGGVQKIDDTTIEGEIISCDGTSLVIETKDANNQPLRQTIALHDLLHVKLGGASITTQPATQRSPTTAPRGAQKSRASGGMVSGLLRMVGLGQQDEEQEAEEAVAEVEPAAPGPPVPSPNAPSTQPTILPTNWRMKLDNGDALHGTLRAWSAERLSVQLESPDVSIDIPAERVVELWHASADLEGKARALKADASKGEDIAYVLKDNDVLAVSGNALGIEGEALSFRYDGQDRKIGLARLLGVVLAAQKSSGSPANAGEFHQAMRFASGNVLSGKWTALRDGAIEMNTLWGQSLRMPAAAVATIEFRNGRAVFLSDLKPSNVEQVPYFDRIVPWRADRGLGGGTLVLSDGQYARGLAVHSRCVLQFRLDGKYERFRSKMGFEQPAGAAGRAAVSVLADGKTLFENADARGDQKPAELDLDVHGAQYLVLSVDFGRDQDVADRVIWANARLLRNDVGR